MVDEYISVKTKNAGFLRAEFHFSIVHDGLENSKMHTNWDQKTKILSNNPENRHS